MNFDNSDIKKIEIDFEKQSIKIYFKTNNHKLYDEFNKKIDQQVTKDVLKSPFLTMEVISRFSDGIISEISDLVLDPIKNSWFSPNPIYQCVFSVEFCVKHGKGQFTTGENHDRAE